MRGGMNGREDGGTTMGGRKDKDGKKPAGREARLGEALRANLVRRKQPADEARDNPAERAMLRRSDRLKPRLTGQDSGGPRTDGDHEGPDEPAD